MEMSMGTMILPYEDWLWRMMNDIFSFGRCQVLEEVKLKRVECLRTTKYEKQAFFFYCRCCFGSILVAFLAVRL